jgi:hypothetical protein
LHVQKRKKGERFCCLHVQKRKKGERFCCLHVQKEKEKKENVFVVCEISFLGFYTATSFS